MPATPQAHVCVLECADDECRLQVVIRRAPERTDRTGAVRAHILGTTRCCSGSERRRGACRLVDSIRSRRAGCAAFLIPPRLHRQSAGCAVARPERRDRALHARLLSTRTARGDGARRRRGGAGSPGSAVGALASPEAGHSEDARQRPAAAHAGKENAASGLCPDQQRPRAEQRLRVAGSAASARGRDLRPRALPRTSAGTCPTAGAGGPPRAPPCSCGNLAGGLQTTNHRAVSPNFLE